MFVEAAVRVPLGLVEARAALDRAVAESGLTTESERAHSEGMEFLMRVGPRGEHHVSSKEVLVNLLPSHLVGGAVIMPLRWVATGPTGHWFPTLEANLTLTATGRDRTELGVFVSYPPLLVRLGPPLDRSAMSALATRTMHALLREVAARLVELAQVAQMQAAPSAIPGPNPATPQRAGPARYPRLEAAPTRPPGDSDEGSGSPAEPHTGRGKAGDTPPPDGLRPRGRSRPAAGRMAYADLSRAADAASEPREVGLHLVLPMLLQLAIIAVDAASPQINLLPFVVVPVLLAAAVGTVRQTVWVALPGVAAGVILAFPKDSFDGLDHVIRTIGVAIVAVFAIYLAHLRRVREAELRRRAMHDPLTGLPNRALLADRLHQLLLRRRPTGLLAVLFVDLDEFKSVNDTHGHAAGDALLRHVAQQLRQVTRAGDTLARFAGDEFVVMCPDLPDAVAATDMARRVLDALAVPLTYGPVEIAVPASVGVAVDSGRADDEALLSAADQAMFEAKRRGDHGYVLRYLDEAASTSA